MRYIIYARKSTEDEDRQVLSIEAQLFELKEFAAKEKLEIVKVQDFGSEFLARPSPPQTAKCVRTILRIAPLNYQLSVVVLKWCGASLVTGVRFPVAVPFYNEARTFFERKMLD